MTPVSSLYQFPLINTAPPAGTPYNPNLQTKRWQPATPVPASAGKVMFPYLDTVGDDIAMMSLPVAQYNSINMQPDGYVAPAGVTPVAGEVPPPIDLTKYNALASENMQIVFFPFGPEIEPIAPPPAAPAQAPQQGTDSANIAEILGAESAYRGRFA